MTEEQLEVLKDYINACIENALARESESEYIHQTNDFKYRMEALLREVFIESPKRTLDTLLQAGVIKGRKQYSKAVAALLSVEEKQGDQ